jgi:hypothetical protein
MKGDVDGPKKRASASGGAAAAAAAAQDRFSGDTGKDGGDDQSAGTC